MPNLATAIRGFEETMEFTIVQKTVVDHEIVENSKAPVILWFEGNVQPMHSRDLMIKPEGQRNFKWWDLWTEMELKNDDIIKDRNGLTYRVMGGNDWSQAGYQKYTLTEGVGLND